MLSLSVSCQKPEYRTFEIPWLFSCKPMPTLRKDVQLGVLDQRVRPSCPRDGYIPVFRSVQDQRWHRERMKLINEVGA